jgi:hypothetical protein
MSDFLVTDFMWRFKWWPYTNSVAKTAMVFPRVSSLVSHMGHWGVHVAQMVRRRHKPLRTSGTLMSAIADVALAMDFVGWWWWWGQGAECGFGVVLTWPSTKKCSSKKDRSLSHRKQHWAVGLL